MEILTNKKMLEIKHSETEVNNVLDKLISRLAMAEKRIKLEDISKETANTEKQREKTLRKYQKRILNVGELQKM